FPNRDLIVFTTAAVIAVTLLIQAPLLPRVVRWARLPEDHAAGEERRRAEITAVEHALDALPALATEHGATDEVTGQLRTEYHRRLRVLQADGDDAADDGAGQWEEQYARLRRAAIDHKHDTIVRLRDDGEIDDEVMLRLQDHLDAEAVHLQHDGVS